LNQGRIKVKEKSRNYEKCLELDSGSRKKGLDPDSACSLKIVILK